MSTLPPTLARWQKQLGLFPEDLATSLGQLVQRLAPAVEAFALTDRVDSGEVDGFDGITQRGSYERLLPSEWALRESLPLEFLRRAAHAEHSFFRIARREPSAVRASLAVFDAGPDQLGGCRLAQLATLLLLVHRAEQQREILNWQLLHNVNEDPLHTLDEQSVQAFLRGRTAERSTPESVAHWKERYPAHELWVVGARGLAPEADARTTAVSITEAVDPIAQQLHVAFSARGRAPRTLSLELPEPSLAIRLLRDPLQKPRSTVRLPPPSQRRHSNVLLNDEGSRLFYLNERRELIGLPIPNARHRQAGSPHCYQPAAYGKIIGVHNGYGRHLHWLCYRDRRVSLHSNRAPDAPLFAECQQPLDDGAPFLWQVLWFPIPQFALFVAPDRSLWRANFKENRATRLGEGVRRVLTWQGLPLVALDHWFEGRDGTSGPCVVELTAHLGRVLWRGPEPLHSVFLNGVNAAKGVWQLGFEAERGALRLQTWSNGTVAGTSLFSESSRPSPDVTLHPPTGSTVVGIESGAQPGFIAIDSSRRELFIADRQTSRTLTRTSAPISQVAVAGKGPALVYTTITGELGVLERVGKTRLLLQLGGT